MTTTHLIEHRNESNLAAVVFIHGYAGNPKKTWGSFPKFLLEAEPLKDWDVYSLGYSTGFWFDLVGIWKADPKISTLAGLLRTRCDYPPLDRYKSLALVAHSMGGLIVQRAILDHPSLLSRVGHVFLFGTPSDGLVKASFFKFWKRQFDDMAAGGQFIVTLRRDWSEKFAGGLPFRFLVVAGEQDEFVQMDSSVGPFQAQSDLWKVIHGDHLSIVKPESPDSLSVQIVLKGLMGEAAPSGPNSAARAAVEAREFRRVVEMLEPRQEGLDERGLVQLALALEGVGRQQDAIKLLEKPVGNRRRDYLDAIGVLAGRLKRRWLVEQQAADAERALELYNDGYGRAAAASNHAQAYYHGINVAFMTLAYHDDLQAAQDMARKVLDHCEKKREKDRQAKQTREDHWCYASEGEANLLLLDVDAALSSYGKAVGASPAPSPREIDSMYKQAMRVASLIGDEGAAEKLEALFRGGSQE